MGTKLHEVLAVEAEKENVAKAIVAESLKNFSTKHEMFQGFEKTLSMEEDGQELIEEAGHESRELHTTVPARLLYTAVAMTAWLDVVLQKDITNQSANANIIVDGNVIAEDVPVCFLLGLETKLGNLLKMYQSLPTLPPGIKWEPNTQAGEDIFSSAAEVKLKTAKQLQFREISPATDKHAAQVEHWNEDKPVGKFTTEWKVGLISSARKHELMARLSTLIQAVKQARMRANTTEVINNTIGSKLFEYLHA